MDGSMPEVAERLRARAILCVGNDTAQTLAEIEQRFPPP